MRIATLILSLALLLAASSQTILAVTVSIFDDDFNDAALFGVTMLIALLLAVAFSYGVPSASSGFLLIAACVGVVGGITTEYSDLKIWGAISVLVACVAMSGSQERNKAIKREFEAENVMIALLNEMRSIAQLAANGGLTPAFAADGTGQDGSVQYRSSGERSNTADEQFGARTNGHNVGTDRHDSAFRMATAGSIAVAERWTQPRLTLAPHYGNPGAIIRADVEGFAPGAIINLAWVQGSGNVRILAQQAAGPQGNAVISFPVPPGESVGTRTLYAGTPDGSRVSASFAVLAGSDSVNGYIA